MSWVDRNRTCDLPVNNRLPYRLATTQWSHAFLGSLAEPSMMAENIMHNYS